MIDTSALPEATTAAEAKAVVSTDDLKPISARDALIEANANLQHVLAYGLRPDPRPLCRELDRVNIERAAVLVKLLMVASRG